MHERAQLPKYVDEMSVSGTLYPSYYSSKKILLVGDGDFSFSLCLAKSFGSATNITATSLDTREELEQKYKDAKENVEELERRGCTVVHGVNVHSMTTDWRISTPSWDRYDVAVFNFPHAGFEFGRDSDYLAIMKHQEVVRGFLRSAKEMVKGVGGEIHITHKMSHPYTEWNIKSLGEENGLSLVKELVFEAWQFPGYSNKYGSGYSCDSSFPVGLSYTFVFGR